MKVVFFFYFFAELLLIMPSAATEPDYEALDALTEGSNKFAIALYQAVSKSRAGNVIVSPVSLQLLLAMTHSGAKEQTAAEIASALGLPADSQLALRGQQSLINLLQLPVLSLANKIYVEESFTLKPEFQNVSSKYFLSEVEGVSFRTNAEGARQNINNWVENKTNKKIKDLLPSGCLDSLTRLVLTNAIHFKANWANKFLERDTSDELFYVTPDQPVTVKMMHINEKFGFRHHPELGAQLLELPYEGRDMRMIIILPDAKDGLADVEKKLVNINLAEEFSKLRQVKVELTMPKFKIEDTIELEDILKELGMKTMFSDAADLSGISDSEPLKVSKAIQKAFIEVNEEGTEAAAATALIMIGCCMPIGPPPEDVVMIADHPFLQIVCYGKPWHPTYAVVAVSRLNTV